MFDGGGFLGVELVCVFVVVGLFGGVEDWLVVGVVVEVVGECFVGFGWIGVGVVFL